MLVEDLTQQLAETLTSRALALFGHPVARVVLQSSPAGDLSTPVAIELATALKRDVRAVAEQLSNGMELPFLVESVTANESGELLFRFDRGGFTASQFRAVMLPPPARGARVSVVYPGALADLTRVRSAVLADAYARCARWLGYRVEVLHEPNEPRLGIANEPESETPLRLGEPKRIELHSAPVTSTPAPVDDWFASFEKKSGSREISIAAIRYAMLRDAREEAIVIDIERALRVDGDSGPYLLQSLARAQNVVQVDERDVDDLTLHQGLSDAMWELVWATAELPGVIRRAVDAGEPSLVAQALLALAEKFDRFAERFPLATEDVAERQRRAVCVEVFRRTMVAGLELLGIPVPAMG
ncbi:MAG TPA: DALR anticodon-binding domain-containing protein [Thermoanaerobaculia bacterium]|nr:DALR anticodon-binding domain-containing protein [Thermoanaerobaculia bacterium]